MVLSAAGTALQVPTFLVPTSGAQAALGPAYIGICLPPPDVPAGTPGRSTFGAKVYSAKLTINGVFSPVPLGAWIAFWTPYNPGIGTVNVAGTVASPAAMAPGAVALGGEDVRCGCDRRRIRHAGRAAESRRERDDRRWGNQGQS